MSGAGLRPSARNAWLGMTIELSNWPPLCSMILREPMLSESQVTSTRRSPISRDTSSVRARDGLTVTATPPRGSDTVANVPTVSKKIRSAELGSYRGLADVVAVVYEPEHPIWVPHPQTCLLGEGLEVAHELRELSGERVTVVAEGSGVCRVETAFGQKLGRSL